MSCNTETISGPFGRYEAGSSGSVLNALYLAGVQVTVVERLTIGDGIIKHNGETFAHYRFFDGIKLPLFRFTTLQHLNEQTLSSDADGTLHPRFKLVLSNHNTPGLIFSGSVATPELHAFLQRSLTNMMNDPWYKVHQEAGAFFQGGSDNPNGGWFYIEFWKPSGAQAYVDKLNAEYKPTK